MEFLSTIKDQLPDWAKDIRLNLDSVIARSTLPAEDAVGAGLAAAYAAGSQFLVEAFKSGLSEGDANAALTAAALMGMNNTWYPYPEMTGDAQLKSLPPQLRMNAYATHGGVDKKRFELFSLTASIIGKCHFCVQSHYENLKKEGMSVEQLRDAGRIAAVVNAAAQALTAQGK
ncbi:carboxymuconolactone decarboxylase [Bordetella trematum]|uniref:Alkyl hydroperoxide reductase AhpD n=1 Tax=Bordetella trematum TaxID=123899 RepID=A0A157SK44_9BORD|nr:carboxymuconolactone decarboxylase family protein [Bordetella trematum]AUL46631.1 carboxymuconolactone decarboxylase family protein [Bordetella trematum]AZR93424.1 carboxymuconolactone decarboxylase [Bordetella trematum]NNH20975.1 carboxymuconolactone decarboxylase family protein [Bordetella trematum]QIM72007.1 carboxymuconolactone decarboxylase family protein [Bordetella trematum]SAI17197.1 antioxidant protein [Bordetella trematum]